MKIIIKLTIGVLILLFSGCSQNVETYPNKTNLNSKNKKVNPYTLMLNQEGHNNIIRDIIVTKDNYLITASDDKTIKVLDYNQKKMLKRFDGQIGKTTGVNYAIALDSNEKYLIAGGRFPKSTQDIKENFALRVFDFRTKELLKLIKLHTDSISDISFSKDNKYFAVSSMDGSFSVWETSSFILKKHIKLNKELLSFVKIIKKDNDYLVFTSDKNSNISIYSLNKDKIINKKKISKKLNSIDISDKYIITANGQDNAVLFDYNLNKVYEFKSEIGFFKVAFSSNGQYLALQKLSINSKPILIYRMNDFKKTQKLNCNEFINQLGFIDKKHIYYTVAKTNSLKIINILKNKIVQSYSLSKWYGCRCDR